ncbi:MAG TPA: hypothetical protein VFR72_05585 [Gemmatimonadales bacterium]|nr:hypothetical protein [Gemmatimonadales bacterium]
MIPSKIWAGLVVLTLVACADEKPVELPEFSRVFPSLPLPPNASVVSRSGGADALQLTLMSQNKASEIEAYYRTVLTKNGWRLVNDQRDRDGGVALLAELKGQPLWVNIKSTDDSVATIVRLAGAVIPDSVKNRPAKAAS